MHAAAFLPLLLGEVEKPSGFDGEVLHRQQVLTAKPLSLRYRSAAPLIGEPLAGRHVFVVWRFAPVGPAGAKSYPCGRSAFWSQ